MPGLPETPKGSVIDLFRLDGQTALVTGGSRGIGAAIAIALAQAGARVILAQRDTSNTSTQETIRAAGGQADIIPCDLSDRADAAKCFDRALQVVDHIDILVNNGGMLKRTDSVDVSPEEWDEVLNVNLHSLFVISQAAGRHFIPRKSGSIINVASLNSYIGGMRVAHYSAAKGAVATLTKALSNEWSPHGIRVNAIAPGSIATDMADPSFVQNRLAGIPGGRWGSPEDFVGPAVFLSSKASAYVTGEIMVVDGVSNLFQHFASQTNGKGAMAKGPI